MSNCDKIISGILDYFTTLMVVPFSVAEDVRTISFFWFDTVSLFDKCITLPTVVFKDLRSK